MFYERMLRHCLKTAVVMLFFVLGSANAEEEKLPADVVNYVEQREGCDYFRGEVTDPPNAQRMKEIEREIRKLCTCTDKKLIQLKRKHAKNHAVVKRLDKFEKNIEALRSHGGS